MDHPILWTDWRTQQLVSLKEYTDLLMTFIKTRFGDKEVEVNTNYQGPGSYRLKYWYNLPGGLPPQVKLDWVGV